MLKRNSLVSLVAIIALCLSILAPFAAPGTAVAASTYTVLTAPTVQVSTTPQALGKLQVDVPEVTALSTGDVLSFTLPAGVTSPNTTMALSNVNPLADIVIDNSISLDKATPTIEMRQFAWTMQALNNRTFNMTLASKLTAVSGPMRFIIDYRNLLVSSAGDVTVVITGNAGSGFSGPQPVTIAKSTSTRSITCAISSANSLDSSGGAIQNLAIIENSTRSLTTGDIVSFELPRGFTWTNNGGVVQDWGLTGMSGTAVVNAANARKLDVTVTNGNDNMTKAGRLLAGGLNITVDDAVAKVGDVEVSISSNRLDVATSTLVVAKYGETGVTFEEDSPVANILAGSDAAEIGNIKVSESLRGSLVGGRNIKITLPTGVKWNLTGGVSDKPILKTISGDGIGFGAFADVSTDWQALRVAVNANGASTVNPSVFKWTKLIVDVSPDFRGDIVADIAGTQGFTGKVKLGTVIAPVEMAAGDATKVNIGSSAQVIPDITIKESAKVACDTPGNIRLMLPAAVTFTSLPTVKVTDGDLVLDTNNITKSTNDGTIYRGVLTIPVKTISTKPSTIVVSGIKVTLDRTVPEGDFNVIIGTNSTSLDKTGNRFTYENIASVKAATCVTPAPVEGTTGSVGGEFAISSNIYKVNGVSKVMDAAPYVKNGRSYVPIRFLGYAMGLTDADIVWDEATQKVTMTKGDSKVELTIGSTTITVNGEAKTMDVAPEISNGRTMLPARFVAEGLGFSVGWDPGTQTILLSK